MLSKEVATKASKMLSYILRHRPEDYQITLDSEGWASLPSILVALKTRYSSVTQEDIMEIVRTDNKGRYQVQNGQIRAVQGHSAQQVQIRMTPKIPPAGLYHGTARRCLSSIFSLGLLPGTRQFVHLSPDIQTALQVGRRHGSPVVLQVQTASVTEPFFQAENGVWLVKSVPPQALMVLDERDQ